jgi:hypothetical protein
VDRDPANEHRVEGTMTQAQTPETPGAQRGAFDSELTIRAVGPVTWKLMAPLIWTGTRGDTFTVPSGFVTDFATVPRFLHWLVSPYGAYTRAAVLHDWLLVELAAWTRGDENTSEDPPADSHDTDGIFRRVMQDLGVPFIQRWIMWTGVRWAALFNPLRSYRRQIPRDLPRMIPASLLILPFALPGVVGVLISLGAIRIVTAIGRAIVRPGRAGQEEG